ncbi:MAG: GAF domain-containing protein [Cytophagales bacterium]
MKRLFYGIVGKIVISFSILIFVFIVNTIVSYFLNTKNQNSTLFISNVQQPSVVALNDFQILVLKTQSYANTWVKTEIEDHPDKKELPLLINNTYPELKEKLSNLFAQWNDTTSENKLKLAFEKYETIAKTVQDIMEDLKTFDDYQDAMKRMENESTRADEVNEKSSELSMMINEILIKSKDLTLKSQQTMIGYFNVINVANMILMAVFISVGIVTTYLLSQSIIKPVNSLKEILFRLTKGEFPDFDIKISKDEIGEMVNGSKEFVKVLEKRTEFAVEIGKGNYENNFDILSENDVLGKALLQMRDNLKKSAIEDKQRNWITNGVAQLGEILRTENQDLNKLYDSVLKFLVKYTGMNQGGMFVLNEESGEPYIELVSCFAYDRKKFLTKKIEIGEGLVGQCVQEGQFIFMNDVPDGYVHITSGTGEANPNCIVIMPLKYNDKILGVIELASFKVLEEFEVEFVSKVAESVASSISAVKVNERTRKLLDESKIQAEILRAQEEEMRQNTEELIATQEEMSRRNKELEDVINELRTTQK